MFDPVFDGCCGLNGLSLNRHGLNGHSLSGSVLNGSVLNGHGLNGRAQVGGCGAALTAGTQCGAHDAMPRGLAVQVGDALKGDRGVEWGESHDQHPSFVFW
jgi:hypothetical protein